MALSWLAHFHATFMGKNPEGLWKIGTYWHLDTRPDELEALEDLSLKKAAPLIEIILLTTFVVIKSFERIKSLFDFNPSKNIIRLPNNCRMIRLLWQMSVYTICSSI